MRKIVSFTHATLNGYIDNPHTWSHQYATEEVQGHLNRSDDRAATSIRRTDERCRLTIGIGL